MSKYDFSPAFTKYTKLCNFLEFLLLEEYITRSTHDEMLETLASLKYIVQEYDSKQEQDNDR